MKKKAKRYLKGKFLEKEIARIFILKGFEVELNREIAGNEIDVLAKKKKSYSSKYQFYVIECKHWDTKITKYIVNKYEGVRNGVKGELKKVNIEGDFEIIIISSAGFTDNAKKAADAHDIILSTYDELLSDLMNFGPYLTFLIQNFKGSTLEKLYIEQDFLPESTMEEINSFDFVKQWLEIPDSKQIFLLGNYGTGKTSFVRKLAYELAKDYKKKAGIGWIPFVVDLRRWQQTTGFKELVRQNLKSKDIEPPDVETFLRLLTEGIVLLIFDAFDEMVAMSNPLLALNNLKEINQVIQGEAKVIVTSRTHYFKDREEVDFIIKKQGFNEAPQTTALRREISNNPQYEIVFLKEFSDSHIKGYLEKAKGRHWESAYEKIKSLYNLHDLAGRPILLDMIVETLSKIEEKTSEYNMAHLYEAYTHSWFEREARRLKIHYNVMEELVEEIAYELWREGKLKIHYTYLSDIIKLKIKTNSLDLQSADYAVRTASFMTRDEAGNYSFDHHSFQEFFIAQKINRGFQNNDGSVLDLKRLSAEIILFLGYMVIDVDRLIQWVCQLLEEDYKVNISENALLLFYQLSKMKCLNQPGPNELQIFNKQIREHLPGKMNLQNASLSGMSLSYMLFRNVKFDRAALENVIVTYCTFENVIFSHAGLNGSDFSCSVFRGVTFEHSSSQYCNFKNCRFDNCTFKDSNFRMSSFLRALFEDSTFESNDFTGCGFLECTVEIDELEKNKLFGTGKPGTAYAELTPLLNLGHAFPVTAVAISPDKQWLVSGSSDKTVKLWDFESGQLLKTFKGHGGAITSVCIGPDNRRIVSTGEDNTLKLWDVENGSLLKSLEGHNDSVTSAVIGKNNLLIVSGSRDASIKLWDIKSGTVIKTFKGSDSAVNSTAISPDNRRIVSGGDDARIRVWDVDSGQLLKDFKGDRFGVNVVAAAPDNQMIVSGGDDNTLKLWDMESGSLIKTLKGHRYRVTSAAISPDNRRMISASCDQTLKIWDMEGGYEIKTLEGHRGWVNAAVVSDDNLSVVSAGNDQSLKLWDLENGNLLKTFAGHTQWVSSVSITPDNRHIISMSYDNTVKWWNLENGGLIKSFDIGTYPFSIVAVSPDNRLLACTNPDRTLTLWNIEKTEPELLKIFEGHTKAINAIAISPDNRWMVSGSDDKTVRLWDMRSGYLFKKFEDPKYNVNAVCISPDNRRIVSGSDDNTLNVWDIESGRNIHNFKGHRRSITCAAISTDNQWLISGSADHSLKLWNMETGSLVHTFDGHKGRIETVSISRDGRWLVSGGNDNTVKLWDFEKRSLVHTCEGHHLRVSSVAISPDNRRIVSGSYDNSIKTWDMENGRLIYSIFLLPGNNKGNYAVFKDNKFTAPDPALPWIYYTDGLAAYHASDLPGIRLKETG